MIKTVNNTHNTRTGTKLLVVVALGLTVLAAILLSIHWIIQFYTGVINSPVVVITDYLNLHNEAQSMTSIVLYQFVSVLILLLPVFVVALYAYRAQMILIMGRDNYRKALKDEVEHDALIQRLRAYKAKRRLVEERKNRKSSRLFVGLLIGLGLGWLFS